MGLDRITIFTGTPVMHPNAPGMAAFTLVSHLLESLVEKDLLDRMDLNKLLAQCAVRNESVNIAATTTNADAAALIRELIK